MNEKVKEAEEKRVKEVEEERVKEVEEERVKVQVQVHKYKKQRSKMMMLR